MRKLLFLFLLFAGVSHGADPAIVQDGYYDGSVPTSGTTASVTLTGVTAGNAIVVMVLQAGLQNRTYSSTSDNDGAPDDWVQQAGALGSGVGLQIAAGYWLDVAGGTTQISVTANASASAYIEVFEVSATDLDVDFVTQDWENLSTADLAGAGTVPVAAESIIFMAWQPSAAATITATGYTATDVEGVGNDEVWYKINTSSIADENGTISESAGTREGPSVFFSLKNVSGGGGGVDPILTITDPGKSVGPHKSQTLGGVLEQ